MREKEDGRASRQKEARQRGRLPSNVMKVERWASSN